MDEFKPELIDNYLSLLTPSNLMVMLEGKSLEPECT